MSQIALETNDGSIRLLDAVEGWSLMEILRAHKLPVSAMCAGTCSCGTCHVVVAEDWATRLAPARDDEIELLETLITREENSRLACQIIFDAAFDGLRIRLA